MQKVAEGEDDTTSTWVSMNCMDGVNYGSDIYVNWWTSKEREYLNNGFLDALSTASGGAGQLVDYIIPVVKDSIGRSIDSSGIMEIETIDRIWVPSATEMFGKRPESKITKLIESAISGFSPVNSSKQWYRLNSVYNANQYGWAFKMFGNENTSYDYSGAFGGANWDYVYPTPQSVTKPPSPSGPYGGVNAIGGPTLKATPSTASKYVRKNKSNTSDVNYMLRSIGDSSDVFVNEVYSGANPGTPRRVYRDFISSSGAHYTDDGSALQGAYFPFGFCL